MEKNTTTSPRPTIANLRAGNVVQAGYVRGQRDMTDANRFVGFKIADHYFSKLQDLKEFYGVRNLRDLEAEASRQIGCSVSVRAEFQNLDSEDPYLWEAYLWKGCFRVGTSADRLTLKAA